ncbi:MAG: chromate transporter [Firmicutes bacterium]|nr:chromate transporter [Bacillota bacterium]
MNPEQQAVQPKTVSLLTVFLLFLKVGAFTFGGGYAMLPIIQREVVARRKWVEESLFFDMLIVAQSLPGAIALNSAIQIGMHLRGIAGGALAALGVIVPSVGVILALAAFFLPLFQDNIYVRAIFYGLRPAVVALIAAAVVNLGRSALDNRLSAALAGALLAAALLLKIHPIAVLLAGGAAGLIIFKEKAI